MQLDLETLETTFDLVAPRGEELMDVFYARLFATDPAVKPLFGDTDLARQKAMLLSTLVLLRKSLRNLDAIVTTLRALGARHNGYGAQPEHYAVVGQVLIASLAEIAGEAWRPEHELAWAAASRSSRTRCSAAPATPSSTSPREPQARCDPMARVARCSAAWTCSSTNGAGRSRGATVVARDAGWDDALDRIVAEVRRAGLTNDKVCALGQFARVALRTPSIDYSGRFFGMSSAAVAAGKCSKSSIGLLQRPDSPRGLIRARATSGLGQ